MSIVSFSAMQVGTKLKRRTRGVFSESALFHGLFSTASHLYAAYAWGPYSVLSAFTDDGIEP